MKVFTSIFVVDGVQTTFDDIELSLRIDESDRSSRDVTDRIRRRITELQDQIGRRCDQPGQGRP